jgi:hypothetical protein
MKLTFQFFTDSLVVPDGLPREQKGALNKVREGILATAEPIFQRKNVPLPLTLEAIGTQYQHWGEAYTEICVAGMRAQTGGASA